MKYAIYGNRCDVLDTIDPIIANKAYSDTICHINILDWLIYLGYDLSKINIALSGAGLWLSGAGLRLSFMLSNYNYDIIRRFILAGIFYKSHKDYKDVALLHKEEHGVAVNFI